jgi:DNA-directed RNA polymerase specialized sigma24 family protein
VELAEYAALHESRLVDSLVAETGLPHADAAAIAWDVVRRAHERGTPAGTSTAATSTAATYAWLRVAARHRALDELRARQGGPTGSWDDAAAAADQALANALGKARVAALDGLSADEREVLRLRYVDGLLPAAIAERLGTTTDAVDARLDRARSGAARTLRRARTAARRRFALTRVGAPAAGIAIAVAGILALDFSGVTTPGQQPRAVRAAEPPTTISLTGDDPAATAPHGTAAAPYGHATTTDGVTDPADVALPTDPNAPDGGADKPPCNGICTNKKIADSVHVPLPQQARDATGRDDLEVDMVVPVCSAIPARPPGEVARCVPGSH